MQRRSSSASTSVSPYHCVTVSLLPFVSAFHFLMRVLGGRMKTMSCMFTEETPGSEGIGNRRLESFLEGRLEV